MSARPLATSLRALALGLTAAAIVAPVPVRADDFSSEQRAAKVLQIALPLAAGICAFHQGRTHDFLAGFAVESITVQGLKYGLGDRTVNLRPNGESHGFPSGHAALSMFGATDLAHKCFPHRPALAALAYGTALAVAASRVHTQDHNGGQALAGLAIGYFSDGVNFSAGKDGIGLGYQMSF